MFPCIQALKAKHPFWEYRRIWAHLHFVEQLPVNEKRILRVMRAHTLQVTPNLKLKAKKALRGSMIRALDAWITYDNKHYLHAARGAKRPDSLNRNPNRSRGTPFVAA